MTTYKYILLLNIAALQEFSDDSSSMSLKVYFSTTGLLVPFVNTLNYVQYHFYAKNSSEKQFQGVDKLTPAPPLVMERRQDVIVLCFC